MLTDSTCSIRWVPSLPWLPRRSWNRASAISQSRSIRPETRHFKTSSHVSRHLRQLIAEKHRARRIYQTPRDPASKMTLTALSNQVKRLLSAEMNDSWKQHSESLSTKDTYLWRTTQFLLNHLAHLSPLHGTRRIRLRPLPISLNDNADLMKT